MNNQIAGILSFLVVCLLYVSSSSAAPAASSDGHASNSKAEMVFLTKLLPTLKELAKDAEVIESLVEKAAEGSYPDLSKRQWNQDYGWGGGRFGKRDYGFGGGRFGKRYDIYGMSGRFGRDVDHVDLINHDRQ